MEMGDSRRPRRTKKEVSYSTFNHSDDDDEDFASFTPPAPKKSKPDKNGKKQSDKFKSKDSKRKDPKERKAVDDRIFDKELELALEMSKAEFSSQSQEVQETSQNEISRSAAEVLVEVHKSGAEEKSAKNESVSAQNTNDKVVLVETGKKPKVTVNQEDTLNADEIYFIETVEDDEEATKSSTGRSRRKAAQKASSKQKALLKEDGDEDGESDVDDDDDFKADEGDLSGSDAGDVEDEEDEDFSFSPKKKKRKGSGGKATTKVNKNKKEPSKKQTKTPKKGNENKDPTTGMKKVSKGVRGQSRGFTPPTLTKKSAAKSPSLPASRQIKRTPAVISPKDLNGNNPLGGVKLVSPGQPFRLGLSRFARVKPLHANPKIP